MIDRRLLLSGLSAAAVLALARRAGAAPVAADPAIEALIGAMSLEEKAGQLTLMPDLSRPRVDAGVPQPVVRAEFDRIAREIRAGGLTGLFNGVGTEAGRRLQRLAVEESRHRIPLLFAGDIIHGLRTVFPLPLAEAASFEPELAQRTARAAAEEATAVGLHWTFAPMVDVARDQRWGRVVEGAGEDPWLCALFAAARVRGFQGPSLAAPDSLLACPKHFVGYGAVTGGMEYASVDLSDQALRDIHLPPFRAAIDAGALTIMSAFNDINGVPSTANRRLLTDLLRAEMGYRGVVTSDYTADAELVAHGYAADEREAAKLAFLAGVDISMASGLFREHLPSLVTDGEVPLAALDASVRRVLQLKKAMGLFDDPYRSLDPERERRSIHLPATHALAREAARRSIVMLKNEGALLPLSKSAQRIALIGPAGRAHALGPHSLYGEPQKGVTLEQGLRVSVADPGTLMVVRGSDFEAPLEGGIEAALASARLADVVVLALGESGEMTGESQSRTEVVIPAPQMALAEAVSALGKPTVLALNTGRALALHGAALKADAILVTWLLGSEAGHAIADVLFGEVSPSGRLPVSFPIESGQEPYFYDHRPTGRPQEPGAPREYKGRYRDTPNEARFPFGHGLTYSTVAYGRLTLSTTTLAWNGTLTAHARITNTGARAVEEVAQLYIHQRAATVTRPVRELKGFRKIALAPGETKDVAFEITRKDLGFIGLDLTPVAEPGTFDLWIAPNAAEGLSATFELLDAPKRA